MNFLHCLLLIPILLFTFPTRAQVEILPLEYDESRDTGTDLLRIASVGDTIPLPFWDDFSTAQTFPDTARWMPGSGVFINSQYPVNPLTYNAATFDGLNAKGQPYNTSSDLTREGPADFLVSRPIDLSGIPAGYDSLYLSFYWQAAGRGDKPEDGDFIRLDFKNNTNAWETIWTKRGDDSAFENPDFFKYIIFKISDAKFLFKGFQFRLVSHGRLAGNFDVWNIDYVYLNKSRYTVNEKHHQDLAVNQKPTRFLRNYMSMPAQHYFHNPSGETAQNISYKVINLDRNIANKSIRVETDVYSNDQLIESLNLGDFFLPSEQTHSFVWNNSNTVNIPQEEAPVKIDIISRAITGDVVVGDRDYKINDTVRSTVWLSNYFAYDDGGAEFALGIINENGGKIAHKFHLAFADTLTAIDIYFPRINKNLSNYQLYLHVWKKIILNDSEEEIVYRQMASLQYSDKLNKFHRYILDEPIILEGEYYIGFQQFTTDHVGVGFDVNSDNSDKIFFKIRNLWKPLLHRQGTLMMRPVFRGGPLLTSINPPLGQNNDDHKIQTGFIYPNPGEGKFYISGEFTSVTVLDLSGKLVHEQSFDIWDSEKEVDLNNTTNGMYLFFLKHKKGQEIHKVILNK